jgi:hypothetical protein
VTGGESTVTAIFLLSALDKDVVAPAPSVS